MGWGFGACRSYYKPNNSIFSSPRYDFYFLSGKIPPNFCIKKKNYFSPLVLRIQEWQFVKMKSSLTLEQVLCTGNGRWNFWFEHVFVTSGVEKSTLAKYKYLPPVSPSTKNTTLAYTRVNSQVFQFLIKSYLLSGWVCLSFLSFHRFIISRSYLFSLVHIFGVLCRSEMISVQCYFLESPSYVSPANNPHSTFFSPLRYKTHYAILG